MASAFRLQLNSAGFAELMRSQEIQADLADRGRRIADAASGSAEGEGDDFEVDATTNRDRAVVFVRTATRQARLAEAEDRALSRAIYAGR